MLSSRPLSAATRDDRWYVDRPERDQLRRLLTAGANVLLVGERGSGKSTLLSRLFDPSERLLVRGLTDIEDLSTALGAPAGPESLEARLQRALKQLDASYVLLDEPALALGRPFAALRDTWWAAPQRFLVAVRPEDAGAWLDRPADVFFDRVELSPLSKEATDGLLQRRVRGLDAGQGALLETHIDELVTVTPARHPGPVLAAARSLVAAAHPEAYLAALRRQAQAVQGLSDRHHALLDALRRLGPTSASDPRLIEEVGVSRSRLVQLLGDLRDLGLVREAGRDGRRLLHKAVQP